jgi:dihydropyrimidinase
MRVSGRPARVFSRGVQIVGPGSTREIPAGRGRLLVRGAPDVTPYQRADSTCQPSSVH